MLNKTDRAVLVLSLVGASFSPNLAALRPAQASEMPTHAAEARVPSISRKELARLVDRLSSRGINRDRLQTLLDGSELSGALEWRIPARSLETDSIYAKFREERFVQLGREFLKKYWAPLHKEERNGGLPAEVQAARFAVESAGGAYTGKELVLAVLVRQSLANSPQNVEANIARLAIENPQMSQGAIKAKLDRAAAAGFYQLLSLLRLDEQGIVSAAELRGSRSGAFGYAQFMPGTYEMVFRDDKIKPNLFIMEDAIAAASALDRLNGSGLPVKDAAGRPNKSRINRILHRYNQSPPYVRAIVDLGGLIRKSLEAETQQEPVKGAKE